MTTDARVVLCNCPDRSVARRLARAVVQQRLAACVNIVPGVESVYWWEGEIQQHTECTLLIKTTRDAWSDLEAALQAGHPDDIPEIIALPVESGLKDYLEWIRASTIPG
ncbi:MAG TPA: divalent-cation tolerance protein CutA [Gammaproteobacteria bacterium]|nr:divalent-cation tolerance protein CutA [Gammaproteobacteria bacterium]